MNNKKISGVAIVVAALSVLTLSSFAAQSQSIPATKIEIPASKSVPMTKIAPQTESVPMTKIEIPTSKSIPATKIEMTANATQKSSGQTDMIALTPAEMKLVRIEGDGSRVYLNDKGEEITVSFHDKIDMGEPAARTIEAQPAK